MEQGPRSGQDAIRRSDRRGVVVAAAVAMLLLAAACRTPPVIAPDAAADGVPAPMTDARGSPPTDRKPAPPDAGRLRVLFLGNSYTFVNDLPSVVRALGAATPGATVEVDSVTLGGARLAELWETTEARKRIAEGGWNVVVLQGQSLEAVGFAESFYKYGRLFAGAAAAVGASTAWYATWARRAGDGFYAAGYTTPAFMTRAIENTYRTAADEAGGMLARVGTAWQLALAEQPAVTLYAEDGSHPTPAGTLLTACVMLQALTGHPPLLPDPVPFGIDRATATALCALAPRVAGPVGCRRAELVHATYSGLSAFRSDCNAAGERMGLACNAAIDQLCASRPCSASGFGPGLASGNDVDVTCASGTRVKTSFAALQSLVPACDGKSERFGPDCSSAISRFCASTGALSGFGPTGIARDQVLVTCVKSQDAFEVSLPYAQLVNFQKGCDGIAQHWGGDCNAAIEIFCRAQGFAGGFGPTDISIAQLPAGGPTKPPQIPAGGGSKDSAKFVCVAW